jgi:hypothetical protein
VTLAQRYLAKARDAIDAGTTCVKSEKSAESPGQFSAGARYKVTGPILGILHADAPGMHAWRDEHHLPRAGVMTIAGEVVLVADVSRALKTGYVDVLGVIPPLRKRV